MPSRGEMAGQVGRRMIAIAPQSHHRACPTHANHRSRATSTRLALHTFLTLRMRTPQDWGANVVFSSRPTSARPQSARGPGGAPAGPGPSMSKVAGKTNQQLEDETEELKRKPRLALEAVLPLRPVRNAELTSAECPPATDQTVSSDLKKAIMQARNAKGMSQKDLAQKLMTDVKTVQEYESGKAIPNNALIAKMERELGAKLPRAPKK